MSKSNKKAEPKDLREWDDHPAVKHAHLRKKRAKRAEHAVERHQM